MNPVDQQRQYQQYAYPQQGHFQNPAVYPPQPQYSNHPAAYGGAAQYPIRGAVPLQARGRGGFMPAPSRGGYPAFQGTYGGNPYGSYAGAMGFRGRRKKPFVGGSLETQRQWEQANLCCFFLQGQCKFGAKCRFSHDDDGVRPCQFGSQCRVGHNNRGGAKPVEAAQGDPKQ